MPAIAVVVGINWLRKGGVLSPRRLSIDVTCVFCAVGLKYYTHLAIDGPEMLMRPLITFGPFVILDVTQCYYRIFWYVFEVNLNNRNV